MKKPAFITVLTLSLLFLIVGSAAAITIIVDGIREPAWDGAGEVLDPNEPNILDGVDIIRFQWTNDQNNFYFLIETAADTLWTNPSSPDYPYVWLCINNDNDTSTGRDFANVCLETGYDRFVRISGPIPLTVDVFDENFALVPGAQIQVATQGAFTELSVDLASLGFGPGNCGAAPIGVYMDGRTADPDDNVLDAGDVPANCGTPTAVTLSSLHALAGAGSRSALLFLVPAALLGLGALLIVQRRRV